jgi:hypothetical protein
LQKLTTRAHQPEIVKRENDWDLPARCLSKQGRAQVADMVHMNDIGSKLAKQLGKGCVDLCVPVPVPRLGVVEHPELNTRIRNICFLMNLVGRGERIFVPREHANVMSLRKSPCERLRVDFASGVVPWRHSMNHEKYAHL